MTINRMKKHSLPVKIPTMMLKMKHVKNLLILKLMIIFEVRIESVGEVL